MRNAHGTTLGKFLWATVVSFILFGCGTEIDPRTLCPTSGAISKTVLILDMSDPLEPHQLTALGRFTNSLLGDNDSSDGEQTRSENYVPKGHMLVVYQLATAHTLPSERFRMCNPGSPDDRTAMAGFTEGEVSVMVRWSQFSREIREAVPSEPSSASQSRSPIIETIRYVRNKEFSGVVDLTKQLNKRPPTIFIVSDLLQNSDILSHYDGLPIVKNLPQSLALNLSGIDIGVRYLRSRRDGHLQTGEHFAWWREFFAEAGAPMSKTPESW